MGRGYKRILESMYIFCHSHRSHAQPGSPFLSLRFIQNIQEYKTNTLHYRHKTPNPSVVSPPKDTLAPVKSNLHPRRTKFSLIPTIHNARKEKNTYPTRNGAIRKNYLHTNSYFFCWMDVSLEMDGTEIEWDLHEMMKRGDFL